ncbi:hypothetical protein KY334_07975 [Candidatus Woesearchaeota archaeon]|nr:hypothetical protein [Candidatus Woesearchaeota archaeon]
MNLKEMAIQLNQVKIDNIEDIAKKVTSDFFDNYMQNVANEVVRQKLENSSFYYEEDFGLFPYRIGGINVDIVHNEMDSSKSMVLRYTRKRKGYDILLFTPFQMNGNKVRSVIERELSVSFVNLPYDYKSIERRFRQYCT